MIMLGNKKTEDVSPIYWKSGVIRKVCILPKAAKTRALMRLVDDGTSLARQVTQLLNVEVKTRVFTESRSLLESIGSSGQTEEKALRQSVAYLKQSLEEGEILGYSWSSGRRDS